MAKMRTIGNAQDNQNRDDFNYNFGLTESELGRFEHILNESVESIESQLEEVIEGGYIDKLNAAADNANEKANIANEKAEYANTQGDYAKTQGDYAKAQGDHAKAQGDYAFEQAERTKILVSEMEQANEDLPRLKQESQEATANAIQATDNANQATTNANNTIDDINNNVIPNLQNEVSTAVADAEQATDNANQAAENIKGWGAATPFVQGTTYNKNNVVTDNGSTFQAKKDGVTSRPPTPAATNDDWTLLALCGLDGEGAVSTVNGISPDAQGNVDLGEIATPQDVETAVNSITKESIGLSNVDNVKQASKEEFDTHVNNKDNPHVVTKEQVGLGEVTNDKQATKTEFDTHANNKSNPHGVTKNQIGLTNVDNVKQMPINGGAFTGQVKAQINTQYTVPQLRNTVAVLKGTSLTGFTENGTLIIVYE